jgi:hypothetical protein
MVHPEGRTYYLENFEIPIREIYFTAFRWDGINSVIKGGNELPHSKCEFSNSQKMKFEN